MPLALGKILNGNEKTYLLAQAQRWPGFSFFPAKQGFWGLRNPGIPYLAIYNELEGRKKRRGEGGGRGGRKEGGKKEGKREKVLHTASAGWLAGRPAGLRLGVIQFTIHILLLNLAGPPELVIIDEDAKRQRATETQKTAQKTVRKKTATRW